MQQPHTHFRSIVLILFIVFCATANAQQTTGTLSGYVHDKVMSAPEKGVTIELQEVTTRTVLQHQIPESTGYFMFRNIPYGSYAVSVLYEKEVLAVKHLSITSALPVSISFDTLREYSVPEVTVMGTTLSSEQRRAGDHTVYTTASINTLPAGSDAKQMETILLNTPGVVPDEDGRLHIRGEDAQIQYVIDGIPVTGNMTRVYSSLFNSQLIKSVDIQTGGLNPEYGVATSGILAISTKSGFDKPVIAAGSLEYGSFATRTATLEVGGNINEKAALYFATNQSKSDRYLDPITNGTYIHDGGEANNYFGKLNALLSDKIELHALGSFNKTEYSIPTSGIKPQNQMQNVQDYLVGVRVNASLNESSLLSVLGYQREAKANVTSDGLYQLTPADYTQAAANNEKFFIGGKRVTTTTGGQIEYSVRKNLFSNDDVLKFGVGGESFPLKEFFTFAVTNPNLSYSDSAGGDDRYMPYDITQGGSPFLVDQSKTGKRFSGYVQDQFRMDKWSINAGLRYDMFSLFEDESSISPRINTAYTYNDDLTLRGSYNYIAMQAPVENILVSSSNEARILTGAQQIGTPTNVRSEKEHVLGIGAAYRYNDYVDFDLSGYGKLINDFIVKVELGNSGIIFPVNLKNGMVAGGELQARLHNWHNFSGLLSFSTCVSLGLKPDDGSSPIGAGLILGEEGFSYSHPFAGEDAFPTEHNQLLTAAFNIEYQFTEDLYGVLGGRFDSGLPFDLTDSNGVGLDEAQSKRELMRRGYSSDVIDLLSLAPEKPGSPDKSAAPHATFDVAAGYNFKNLLHFPARLSLNVINVFDTAYLYKFESSFGGTHFGMPRTVALKLAVEY